MLEKLPAIECGTFDVVLSTYDTFRNDQEILASVRWNCAIFDEVHKIKGRYALVVEFRCYRVDIWRFRKAKMTVAANAIHTQRRYGLTGTVMQNNFEELFTLIDFVRVCPAYG